MNVIDIDVSAITTPADNPNTMEYADLMRLRNSIERFGFLVPLVVRQVSEGQYETVGGAHRLDVCIDLGHLSVPCVVVEADDAEARLLSQALNRVHGEDDLGLRAETLRKILERLPANEVLDVLPESSDSLKAITSLGTQDLASHLQAWEAAQEAKLRHLTLQLLPGQVELVEEAMALAMSHVPKDASNPNLRGDAIYIICSLYMDRKGGSR